MVGKGLAMLYATDEKSEARKIMAKRKFYVVWQGIRPGVYSSWDDCKAQVSGVENARYKSFETREEAEAAFNDNPWKHLGKTGTKPRKPPLTKATYILESIAVDAACSGNPGLMEYRGSSWPTVWRSFMSAP
jgi:ribonuclease HI